MKIIQDIKFHPVTVIIETKEEFELLKRGLETVVEDGNSTKAIILLRNLHLELEKLE